MQWKPIETAPKDGSKFIALLKDDVCLCWWVDDDFFDGSEYWQNEADSEPDPTHWMPLPPAPETEQ